MANQYVFKRYEIKYMLTQAQKKRLLDAMASFMEPDRYGVTTIRNLYFDTDSYRLIRRSMEKPIYKEKLRIRSYRSASGEDTVFVELKKKYDDVVYKRRLEMPYDRAMDWLTGNTTCSREGQIAREIDYFLGYYKPLQPRAFLSYDRQAWFSKDGSDLRLTFDEDILGRSDELSLGSPIGGTPLLKPGKVLLEVKTMGGIPLWLTGFLTQEHIYKTPFSKYGKAYETLIYNGGTQYAGNNI